MFKKINISVNGTEWEFISNLISHLEAAGLECLTDTEALQTAMENASGEVIPIEFQYGAYKLILTRNSSNYSQHENCYTVSFLYNDTVLHSKSLQVLQYVANSTMITVRTTGILIVSADDITNIIFYNHTNGFCMEVFAVNLNDEICYSYSDIENTCAIQNVLTAVESKIVYTVHNTMTFPHNDLSKIMYIAGKLFMSSGSYAATAQSLIDCTKVTPRTVIEIDDQFYYALSANTLLAIENE